MNLRLRHAIIAKRMKVERIAEMMEVDLNTFFFKLNGHLPMKNEERSQVAKILGYKQDDLFANA